MLNWDNKVIELKRKVKKFIFRQEATVTMFAGHIVIAIFSDETSPLLGLR